MAQKSRAFSFDSVKYNVLHDPYGLALNYDGYGGENPALTCFEEAKCNVLRPQNELGVTRFKDVKCNVLRARKRVRSKLRSVRTQKELRRSFT